MVTYADQRLDETIEKAGRKRHMGQLPGLRKQLEEYLKIIRQPELELSFGDEKVEADAPTPAS